MHIYIGTLLPGTLTSNKCLIHTEKPVHALTNEIELRAIGVFISFLLSYNLRYSSQFCKLFRKKTLNITHMYCREWRMGRRGLNRGLTSTGQRSSLVTKVRNTNI